MPVKAEVKDIETTVSETLDIARQRDADKKAQSRLKVYRKALKEVQQTAGNDPMRTLADWIRTEIRETGPSRRGGPSERKVLTSVAPTARRCPRGRGSERSGRRPDGGGLP